jgi:hypothetical protein
VPAPEGPTKRTLRLILRRTIGLTWLGNASTEEYAVALWLEQEGVRYQYLARFGGFRRPTKVDFRILGQGRLLVLEVQGDRWHADRPNRAADGQRYALLGSQRVKVVEVWGRDIVKYRGYPAPTDDSFNRVMRAAIRGVQLSQP